MRKTQKFVKKQNGGKTQKFVKKQNGGKTQKFVKKQNGGKTQKGGVLSLFENEDKFFPFIKFTQEGNFSFTSNRIIHNPNTSNGFQTIVDFNTHALKHLDEFDEFNQSDVKTEYENTLNLRRDTIEIEMKNIEKWYKLINNILSKMDLFPEDFNTNYDVENDTTNGFNTIVKNGIILKYKSYGEVDFQYKFTLVSLSTTTLKPYLLPIYAGKYIKEVNKKQLTQLNSIESFSNKTKEQKEKRRITKNEDNKKLLDEIYSNNNNTKSLEKLPKPLSYIKTIQEYNTLTSGERGNYVDEMNDIFKLYYTKNPPNFMFNNNDIENDKKNYEKFYENYKNKIEKTNKEIKQKIEEEKAKLKKEEEKIKEEEAKLKKEEAKLKKKSLEENIKTLQTEINNKSIELGSLENHKSDESDESEKSNKLNNSHIYFEDK